MFIDVDKIEAATEFPAVLDRYLRRAKVLLVLIGPGWLNAPALDGKRRLDDPTDFVRIEIERALKQGIVILPVLIDGAKIPRPEELPPSLAPLTSRQLTTLAHESYARDIRNIEFILAKHIIRWPRVRGWAAVSVATLCAVAFGSYLFLGVTSRQNPTRDIPGDAAVIDPTQSKEAEARIKAISKKDIRVELAADDMGNATLLIRESPEIKNMLRMSQLEFAINDGEFEYAPLPDRIELVTKGIAATDIKNVRLRYRFFSGQLLGPFD